MSSGNDLVKPSFECHFSRCLNERENSTQIPRVNFAFTNNNMTRCLLTLWLATVALNSFADSSAASDPTYFGFTGPETFPIDPFISDLRAADLDGDGLMDVVVVNNSRSKITLLFNQTGKT